MNVHAMSSGTANSQLTQIPNHRTAGLNRQGKIPSLTMHSARQNAINGPKREEAMENASEKAREAGQRKNPASAMKSKINLYA